MMDFGVGFLLHRNRFHHRIVFPGPFGFKDGFRIKRLLTFVPDANPFFDSLGFTNGFFALGFGKIGFFPFACLELRLFKDRLDSDRLVVEVNRTRGPLGVPGFFGPLGVGDL